MTAEQISCFGRDSAVEDSLACGSVSVVTDSCEDIVALAVAGDTWGDAEFAAAVDVAAGAA